MRVRPQGRSVGPRFQSDCWRTAPQARVRSNRHRMENRPPKSWWRRNCKPMRLLELMAFQLPCFCVTGLRSSRNSRTDAHIAADRLPAQSMFEHFTEKLAAGALKAEPLSHVVSLFEEEPRDSTIFNWTLVSLSRPNGGISVQSPPMRRVSE